MGVICSHSYLGAGEEGGAQGRELPAPQSLLCQGPPALLPLPPRRGGCWGLAATGPGGSLTWGRAKGGDGQEATVCHRAGSQPQPCPRQEVQKGFSCSPRVAVGLSQHFGRYQGLAAPTRSP